MNKETISAGGSHAIGNINPPKTVNQVKSEASVSVDQIDSTISFLVGRICTIVDASYADKEQATAIKQLIKNELYEASSRIEEWVVVDRYNDSMTNPFPFWEKLAKSDSYYGKPNGSS